MLPVVTVRLTCQMLSFVSDDLSPVAIGYHFRGDGCSSHSITSMGASSAKPILSENKLWPDMAWSEAHLSGEAQMQPHWE